MKKPTIPTSEIRGGNVSPEVYNWRMYRHITLQKLGLGVGPMSCGKTIENSNKTYQEQADRFSTDYATFEEFDSDINLVLSCLERMEYAPKDIVDKLERAVKETNRKSELA